MTPAIMYNQPPQALGICTFQHDALHCFMTSEINRLKLGITKLLMWIMTESGKVESEGVRKEVTH